MTWSRRKSGLYIHDALTEFVPDIKHLVLSPPAQYRMYKQRLMVTHLVGFGGGTSGENGSDVTSYSFDGTGDYLSVPDSANWDVIGSSSGNYTISMWVKFSGAPSGSQFFMGQEEADADRWTLYNAQATNNLKFIAKSGGTNIINLTGSSGVADTNWHWIVLVKVDAEYGIYLDGTQNGYLSDSSTDTFATGLDIGGGGVDAAFPGNIDDIIIADSNIYSATPNSTPNDTITDPAVPYTDAALLRIHCGETIVSGTTGSGATFKDSTGVHTVTENGNAIRDTTTYKY